MPGRHERSNHINWNQVFYFSQIAETGSMKAAAERLGLSSSTLSEHLSQLEADLHLKLFQRQHRKLALTSEGARLFQYARQMFETGRRFIDVIAPTPLGNHPICVGMVPGSSFGFAYSILHRYLAEYQDLSLTVTCMRHERLETALLEARVDFGFTDRRSERRDIVQSQIASSELGFFISSRVPNRSLNEHLESMPLVLCQSDRLGPSVIEEVLDSLDIHSKRIVVAEYPSFVKYLCQEGLGIAVLGKGHFINGPSMKMLELPAEFPALVERLYLTWAADAGNAEAVIRLKPLLGPIP